MIRGLGGTAMALAMTFGLGISSAGPIMAIPDTAPSVTPSTISPGTSPAMTFTYTVASALSAGEFTGIGLQGFTVPGGTPGESATPVLSGTTVTCTFASGVVATWASTGFSSGPGGGSAADCTNYDYTSSDTYNYFELYLGDDIALGAGTMTLTISAGGFTAPSTPGSYQYQGYVWDGSNYVEQGFGTITVGNAGSSNETTVIHQSLPMPKSGYCTDINDVDFAWGTSLTGGWYRAWEPWVDSTGGWACSRVMIKTGNSHWTITS